MKANLGLVFFLMSFTVFASEVSINFAKFEQQSNTWKIAVTLEHPDTGWEHYANAWRVVDAEGNELAKRVLVHPHVNEQPFTRKLDFAKLPDGIDVVYVEASDTLHGWSSGRVKVDLNESAGDRYTVKRD
jgi:hypothetical protein